MHTAGPTEPELDAKTEQILSEIYLPKWTGCVIRGDPVSEEVAERICVQTGSFNFWSNSKALEAQYDEAFERAVTSLLKESGAGRDAKGDTKGDTKGDVKSGTLSDYQGRDRRAQLLADKCGRLTELQYLRNGVWCSATATQRSWITWKGVVSYDANLGKDPDIEEIYSDWTIIAERFPELRLTCQLYPCELCELEGLDEDDGDSDGDGDGDGDGDRETDPLVQFTVADGKVTVQGPGDFEVETPHPAGVMSILSHAFGDPYRNEMIMHPAEAPEIISRVSQWWGNRSGGAVSSS